MSHLVSRPDVRCERPVVEVGEDGWEVEGIVVVVVGAEKDIKMN